MLCGSGGLSLLPGRFASKLCWTTTLRMAAFANRGGGGIMQARISAIQILNANFVRNFFGVFKGLCGCTLTIASAHCFS